MSDVATYCLDLGGVVIELTCQPPAFAATLAKWFNQPSADAPPHIRLELAIISDQPTSHFPTSLVTTKTCGANGTFDVADGLFSGHFNPATARGIIRARETLTRGPLMRILEQIFYQAFWSARKIAGANAFLIHSAAVIAHGRGFLFVGPSEAGKSTVAQLSQGHHVLGDEMNIVRETDDGLVVAGTVFNGLFRDKKPGTAPLAGVFILRQAPHHALVAADLLESVVALAAEIVPPVGLDELPGRNTLPQMMDLAEVLATKTTLKVLEFLPDDGFWQVINDTFALNRGNQS